MSSKIFKNCKKAILHLLKSINFTNLPFDFDSLSTDGIETIKVWYHKNYPYSYENVISKTTIIFNNGTQIFINQHMLDLNHYFINVEILSNGLSYEINLSELNNDKIHSYNRAIKQAYSQRDFWQEVEL